MNQKRINFFIPLEIEKSADEKGKKKMLVKGVASTKDKDTDDEELDTSGFDLSYLNRYGFLNWHHQAKGTPAAVIGEPTKAELTPKGLYIEGELYADSKLAKEVYQLAELLEKSGSTRHLGFSIEGNVVERGSKDEKHPDFKKILKSQITGVAITHMPKNNNTLLSIMKGQAENLYEEVEFEVIEKGQKGETNLIIDITDDLLDQRITVDKDLNLKIEKAGEGSRGGKIIGHTKSGKPIYSSTVNYHDLHKNFTAKDHEDAKQHHLGVAKKHFQEAEEHEKRSEDKTLSSEQRKEHEVKMNESSKLSGVHSSLADYHRSEKFKAPEKEIEKSIDTSNAGAIIREDLEHAVHISPEEKKKKEQAICTITKAFTSGQIDEREFENIKRQLIEKRKSNNQNQ